MGARTTGAVSVGFAVALSACAMGCSDPATPVSEGTDGTVVALERGRPADVRVRTTSASVCPAPFVPAPTGCSMAHCDPQMSDRASLPPPPAGAVVTYQDASSHGSSFGLGCASNGTRAACSTFGDDGKNLVVLDANGKVWSSDRLGILAVSSSPLVDAQGGVIAADATRIVRFAPDGAVLWDQPLVDPAPPISPIVLPSGHLFVATTGGPVSVYDSACGTPVAALRLTVSGKSGYYDTVNTPGARADRNRVYVVTAHKEGLSAAADGEGRLFAIDVDPAAGVPIRVRWSYPFRAPSGASVTVLGDRIYFDGGPVAGDPEGASRAFGLRDLDDAPVALWRSADGSDGVVLPGQVQASFAHDPRGGLWMFSVGVPRLERRDELTGAVVQSVSTAIFSTRVDERISPTSAMTMSGSATAPTITFGAGDLRSVQGDTYVLSLDVGALVPRLRARVRLGRAIVGVATGQFPIVRDAAGASKFVFTSFTAGPFLVGSAAEGPR